MVPVCGYWSIHIFKIFNHRGEFYIFICDFASEVSRNVFIYGQHDKILILGILYIMYIFVGHKLISNILNSALTSQYITKQSFNQVLYHKQHYFYKPFLPSAIWHRLKQPKDQEFTSFLLPSPPLSSPLFSSAFHSCFLFKNYLFVLLQKNQHINLQNLKQQQNMQCTEMS